MRIYAIALFFIFCFQQLQAQLKFGSVKGVVVDAFNNDTLENATVVLVRGSDFKTIIHTITGKGGFLIQNVPLDFYKLVTSFAGYKNDTLKATVLKDTLIDIGEIELRPTSELLMEVVVRANIHPLTIRNDTLIFNPDAVKTQPNATIEDLLKRLPGIEVDREETITIQGKRVEKIYIDGKEFFLNDAKVATQNLTADLIESIEAYDYKDDRERFTGIRQYHNTKAINLSLKDGNKKVLNGNVTAGGGTRNNFTSGANATALINDQWLHANIASHYRNNRSSAAGVFEQRLLGTLNCHTPLSENLQLVINATMKDARTTSGLTFSRETFLSDSSLIRQQRSVNSNRFNSRQVTAGLSWKIDSLNTITIAPTITFSKSLLSNKDSSVVLTRMYTYRSVSSGNISNEIPSNAIALSNSITWQRAFRKPYRTLQATIAYTKRQNDQDGKLYSALVFFDNGENRVVDQHYYLKDMVKQFNVDVSFTEPLGKRNFVNVGYKLNADVSRSEKKSFSFDELSGKYSVHDSLTSSLITSDNALHSVIAGYNLVMGKSQYQAGVSLSQTRLNTFTRTLTSNAIKQNNINWAPSLSANYNLRNGTTLLIRYNGENAMPTTDMLQPVPDISNPYVIRLGNPNLKQQFTHVANLNYTATNMKTMNNLMLEINARIETERLSQSSLLTAGGIQRYRYVNVNGVYNFYTNVAYNVMLNRGKNGSINFTVNIQRLRDVNWINEERNVNLIFACAPTARLNYHICEVLFLNANVGISYTKADYSIGDNLDNKLFSQSYNTEIIYRLPGQINLQWMIGINKNGKQNDLPSRTVTIWNASVFKTIFKNKGEIKFEGFDLLNDNNGFERTIGNNYIESRETNVQRRYFMVSFKYRFNVR